MINAYLDAQPYATRIANKLQKLSLMEFFNDIHDKFYPDKDITFMEKFIKMMQHENEFCVPGEKLREYGIIASTRSSTIKEKLDSLGLIEGEHYRLQDVLKQSETSRGIKYKKEYHLTPDAFKLCLMRAQRRVNQPVDPVIFANYYLLLEKVFGLYRLYQLQYSERLLSMKDGKIDRMQASLDRQSPQQIV
ncbi:hypothetical protein GN244_ATG16819 [Phytophthora infestans]|uniref:Uncharacterized protein n=1 Tax=Phytophthora infestans TaxID=4787 RepID=A0A833SSH9_PHYIN|nr:hypothetical protein GN244_ATG16819 [Phytophthora infestans]KAF4141789.1 hypothetical protein GN958_ATG09034 [Phytophthora infestans]